MMYYKALNQRQKSAVYKNNMPGIAGKTLVVMVLERVGSSPFMLLLLDILKNTQSVTKFTISFNIRHSVFVAKCAEAYTNLIAVGWTRFTRIL